MCGNAGVMFENGADPAERALIDMLDGWQHCGPDSTGSALYGDTADCAFRLRFFVGEGRRRNPRTRSATPGTVSRSIR